jgi:hypothetical protein
LQLILHQQARPWNKETADFLKSNVTLAASILILCVAVTASTARESERSRIENQIQNG